MQKKFQKGLFEFTILTHSQNCHIATKYGLVGLTRGEYDSEERKRSKEEKLFLMTSVGDLMTQEGATIACAKRRDAPCFIRFMIEQMSVPTLNTCVKMLKEGDERAKALLLLALLDMHKSKP